MLMLCIKQAQTSVVSNSKDFFLLKDLWVGQPWQVLTALGSRLSGSGLLQVFSHPGPVATWDERQDGRSWAKDEVASESSHLHQPAHIPSAKVTRVFRPSVMDRGRGMNICCHTKGRAVAGEKGSCRECVQWPLPCLGISSPTLESDRIGSESRL